MKLTAAQIEEALGGLPGWRRDGEALTRTFDLGSFRKAVGFIDAVAPLAEKANHHPDLDLRFAKVKVTLSTHDEGGVTQKDVALARELSRLA